jgi:PAS domain S-box-containing protein
MRFLTKLWLAQFSILMLVVAIFAGSSIAVMDRVVYDNHTRILGSRLEAIERELDALTLEAGIGRAVVRDVLRRHTAGNASAQLHAFAFAPDGTRIYPLADAVPAILAAAPVQAPTEKSGVGWIASGDSRILASHATLANTGIVVGVGEHADAVYDWHRRYIAGIAAAALAVLLGGSVAAWLFGRRVSRRVAETQAALESIRTGEFGVRIDTEGASDEIASIQTRINEMADSFARRSREREIATRWLEESEERFRDFAESTSDALWETDADLRYTSFVNPGTDFASVMEGEGVIGKRRGEYFRIFAVDDPGWKKHLEDLDNHRPFRAFTFSGVYPDGTVFHRVSSGVPKFDAEGRFLGYRGTTKDITDLVEAERSLEGLVANIPGLLFQRVVHPDDSFEYVYVKGNATAVFGDIPPDELARMATSLERIHPDDREMFRRNIVDGARSGKALSFEFRQLLPNGDVIWKRSICSATTVRPDGALVQHGVSIDITDLKNAETGLRVARDRLLDFAATGSDTLWETDDEHRLIWVTDPAVPERRHYPREALLGTRRWEFPGVEPVDGPSWAQHLDDLAHRRPFRDFEFSSTDSEGRRLYRRVSGRPLFDEDGAFIGYRGTSTDITERVEAEKIAREHQKRLLDAIQSSDKGVALFDSDDRLVFVNDAWRKLQPHVPGMVNVGASFEEIVVGAGLQGLLDNARPDPADWARRRLAYHRNPEGNFATVPIDGRMIEIRDERLPDGGSIVHLADVTSEYEFQEALLASEERFRGFAESGSDWIWETDEQHRIVWLSASMSAHSDFRIEDMLGKTRWEIFGIDLAQDRHWRSLKEDMDAHRRIRDFRWSRVARNGRVLHRVMNGTPFYDSAGRFRGYRGAVTDSTALVEAENRAQQAERRFVEAINNINEALFLFDPDDRSVFANRRAHELFGIDAETAEGARLEGMSFGEILRGHIQRGLVPISRGEETAWLAARMEHHRNPAKTEPFVIRRSDGIVLEVREELLPDGSVMMFQNDISARVEAEQARHESEQRFRDFAEASSDWLWETDADFRFTWVSEGISHGDRMTSSDFVGRTRWDVFGADIEHDERWRSHIEDLLARRPFRDVRLSRIGEEGQRLYRSVSGVPFYDPLDGSFLGYRGTTTDITAQVEAEQRYRNLIEQSPTPVLVHHGDILAYANPAAIEMFGAQSEADLIGHSITELVHPDDLPEFESRLARIVNDGVVTDLIQQRRLRLDGSEIVVISRGVPVIWEGRRAVLGALIDVTDRVKAERQYRELIESAPMAISVDDGEHFIFVNQAFAELFGAASPEEVVGRPIIDMVVPEEMEEFRARVQAVAEHREILETAQFRRRRFDDGSPITVLTRGVPIQWEGKPATLGIQVDITDRIAVQEALRNSEERFRNLVEGSRQGVLLHVDYKPVFVNAALAEMFGFDSVDEVLEVPSILDLVAPEHRELWRQNREARLGGLRVPESYEFMGIKKDGSSIWVHITVRVVSWEGRTALQGTMIDITDRRRAEDLIRASEERFRTLTSLSPVGFFVADEAGNCEYVNEAYETMSGRSLEECVGQGWVTAIHPDERDRVFEDWYAAARLGRPFRTEFRFLRPDGEVTWGIAQAAAQRDAGGRIVNFVGAVTDVTARKRMEKALEDSEERFRMLTSLSPVGVFLTDRRGELIYVNEALAEMLGMPGEQALGRNWASGIHPEDRDQLLAEWRRAFTARQDIRVEIRIGDGGEHSLWVLIQASPLRSPVGADTGYIGAVTNVTERRNAEEQLRQVQKMDAVGQLTGGIAHDFNNLLAIVQGNLELLRERAPDEQRLHSLIEAAHSAARRGANLNQRLLAFARRQPLRPVVCDINQIVSDMAGLFIRTLGDNIELRTHFAERLWLTNIDPNGLETAVLNLAINARDAMPEGGSLVITTENARYGGARPSPAPEIGDGDFVVVRVTDTGTGMDRDTLSKAFEPFFTTKGLGKGSGLGLSMVYGFARQSGGHTLIESAPGRGTSISLYFPRDAAADAAVLERTVSGAAPPGSGEHILVVEDDGEVRDMAIGMFVSLNYRPVEAGSADEALRILENRNDIELLFTDVMLGNGDNGPELARKARQQVPGLRVLFTSGYAKSHFDGGEPLEAGALISKPYERAELARAVRTALETGRA